MFPIRLRNGRCDGRGKRKGGNSPKKKKFNFSLVATFLQYGTSPLLFWHMLAM